MVDRFFFWSFFRVANLFLKVHASSRNDLFRIGRSREITERVKHELRCIQLLTGAETTKEGSPVLLTARFSQRYFASRSSLFSILVNSF